MPRRSDQITAQSQRVVTVTQAAAQDGRSRATILRKLKTGELRGRMVGGRWLIDAKSLNSGEDHHA
jgi:excisionase family DNA binding protein